MSYSEQNGQVVLTMSRKDYEVILVALGEGNEHFTPYKMNP